jgi:hypothetical protein
LGTEIKKCDELRTTTQRELIAKRTICWASTDSNRWMSESDTLTIDQLLQKLIAKIRVFGRFQQELAGLTPD